MSDVPCTGCRSTRNGRLFYAYLNHYAGDDLERRRLRLCRDCVADYLAPLLEGADYQEDGQWIFCEARAIAESANVVRFDSTKSAQAAVESSSGPANTSTSTVQQVSETTSAASAGAPSVSRPSKSSGRQKRSA